jgi:hypothetical protein
MVAVWLTYKTAFAMFPNARNSLRRWSGHRNKIPIPISVTIYNLLTEQEQDNLPTTTKSKWFRPEHASSLLQAVRLEIVVAGSQIIYSSESPKSVHPSWEHLDERLDLPDNWWGQEDNVYRSMKMTFLVLVDSPPSLDHQGNPSTATTTTTLLEIPVHPALLEKLQSIPEALPPNSCLVYFSDGSTRVTSSLFQVLVDSKLTEPPHPSEVEDFSRFEDDVFRTLDQVTPQKAPNRERITSVSALLENPSMSEDSQDPPPMTHESEREQPLVVSFEKTELETTVDDLKIEEIFLEALIAQEEMLVEQEMAQLGQV